MTFALDSVRYKPSGFWMLDDDSPFTDYSGYGRSGSASTQPAKHISLATGAAYASVFSTSCVGTFAAPVFNQGRESQPFTLGAVVCPLASSGEQQILGNTGRYDGLVINGTKIGFVTKYANSGEARAEFDLQVIRTVVVYGVHTVDKNSLYIDGELVAEAAISEEQQNDMYVTTNTNLYTGQTATDQALAVNGIAVYPYALYDDAIIDLSLRARDFNENSHRPFNGTIVDLNADSTIVSSKRTWSTEGDWRGGTLNNITIDEGDLIPTAIGETPMPGTWLTSFPLDTGISLYGVYLNWDGEGVHVETSLDGNTWETVTRGKKIASISENFDPTDKTLQIRVTFDGDLDAYLESLDIVSLASGTISHLNSRPVSLTGATPMLSKNSFDLNDLWGTRLDDGTITIGDDPSDSPVGTKTVEIWMKPQTTIDTNLTGATIYSNGGSVSALTSGQWQIRTYVFDSALTGPITISGTGQVGRVVLYPNALSANDVAEIYNSNVRRNTLRANDNSVINVAEPADATDIYARDWSISVAG